MGTQDSTLLDIYDVDDICLSTTDDSVIGTVAVSLHVVQQCQSEYSRDRTRTHTHTHTHTERERERERLSNLLKANFYDINRMSYIIHVIEIISKAHVDIHPLPQLSMECKNKNPLNRTMSLRHPLSFNYVS